MHRPSSPARRAGPVLLAAALLLTATAAQAIVQGHPSGLDRHVVRIAGRAICSGVAIDRTIVVTAAHCPAGGVIANGVTIGVVSKHYGSVSLENGTRVTVSGDSAFLKLRAPLPSSISPVPVAAGTHDGHYIIAGYGTPSESHRSYGALREAVLIDSRVERNMLVDPHRSGTISASACFGDSGGPVLQRGSGGYQLVGVISRANHPNRPIACGFYTRYAPVRASGTAVASVAKNEGYALSTLTSADIASPPPAFTATPRTPQPAARSAQANAAKNKAEPQVSTFAGRMRAWRTKFRVADN